jgi:hypothetical protein
MIQSSIISVIDVRFCSYNFRSRAPISDFHDTCEKSGKGEGRTVQVLTAHVSLNSCLRKSSACR